MQLRHCGAAAEGPRRGGLVLKKKGVTGGHAATLHHSTFQTLGKWNYRGGLCRETPLRWLAVLISVTRAKRQLPMAITSLCYVPHIFCPAGSGQVPAQAVLQVQEAQDSCSSCSHMMNSQHQLIHQYPKRWRDVLDVVMNVVSMLLHASGSLLGLRRPVVPKRRLESCTAEPRVTGMPPCMIDLHRMWSQLSSKHCGLGGNASERRWSSAQCTLVVMVPILWQNILWCRTKLLKGGCNCDIQTFPPRPPAATMPATP